MLITCVSGSAQQRDVTAEGAVRTLKGHSGVWGTVDTKRRS